MTDDRYTYIIKRLGSQELGSQQERYGKTSRGRYLFVSKKEIVLKEFPKLSDSFLNDSVLLTLLPLYGETQQRLYCDFVYHNSKLVGHLPNGRNEYRIYFPHKLDNKGFFKNDILVFRRDYSRHNDDDSIEDVFDYLVDWYRPATPEWAVLDYLLKNDNYLIFEGNLAFFEEKVPQEGLDLALGTYTSEIIERLKIKPTPGCGYQLEAYSKMFDAMKFKDFVLTTYGNCCAITGEIISYKSINNLDVVQIQPKSQGGLYLPQNGIALRNDIHWAFDNGMFYIDEHLRVHVAEEVMSSYLGKYNGLQIKPVVPQFAPFEQFLKYHEQFIFKRFLDRGPMCRRI